MRYGPHRLSAFITKTAVALAAVLVLAAPVRAGGDETPMARDQQGAPSDDHRLTTPSSSLGAAVQFVQWNDPMRQGMMGPGGSMPHSMWGQGMPGTGMMGHMMDRRGQMMSHGLMMMRRLFALDLSKEQRKEIQRIHLQTRKKVIPKQADLEVAWLDVEEILLESPPDREAIRRKLSEVGDQVVELQMLWVDALEESRKVLTEEQRERFMDPNWQPLQDSDPSSESDTGTTMRGGRGRHHMGAGR